MMADLHNLAGAASEILTSSANYLTGEYQGWEDAINDPDWSVSLPHTEVQKLIENLKTASLILHELSKGGAE